MTAIRPGVPGKTFGSEIVEKFNRLRIRDKMCTLGRLIVLLLVAAVEEPRDRSWHSHHRHARLWFRFGAFRLRASTTRLTFC